MNKLKKNDELALPILKRIKMLTRKDELGQLNGEITKSINLILKEAEKMINEHEERYPTPLMKLSTGESVEVSMPNPKKKEDFEITDNKFSGILMQKYMNEVHPIEKKIHDLIYKELKKIMSLDE